MKNWAIELALPLKPFLRNAGLCLPEFLAGGGPTCP